MPVPRLPPTRKMAVGLSWRSGGGSAAGGPRRRREQGTGREQPTAGIVMLADHQPRADDAAGDDHGHPAFGEFIDGVTTKLSPSGKAKWRRRSERAGAARRRAGAAAVEAGEGEHEVTKTLIE